VTSVQREHLSRRKLLARLPESGTPGWTSYAPPGASPRFGDAVRLDRDDADRLAEVAAESDTGTVLFAGDSGVMLVVPPFPIDAADDYSELYTRPLVDLLERKRNVAALLLRLGGFTVGYFRGGVLVDSKTDQRFVKNRHRKGGQSQRRFDRIREKQIYELFGKACHEAREKLDDYQSEIEYVLLGGDRHTLIDFRKQCSYFERYGARVLDRILAVPGNPRRESLDDLPHEIWSSEVYTLRDE
jgi:peptide subunit release factor 1 (eRF1)